MSVLSTGSLAGLAGTVGNLEAGQGLAEFSRQLTRGGYKESDTPDVNWVLPPIETFGYAANDFSSIEPEAKHEPNWFIPALHANAPHAFELTPYWAEPAHEVALSPRIEDFEYFASDVSPVEPVAKRAPDWFLSTLKINPTHEMTPSYYWN
ncbi:MAG: hypothetical protein AB8B83_00295 [Bdellovibrionales bacterium]